MTLDDFDSALFLSLSLVGVNIEILNFTNVATSIAMFQRVLFLYSYTTYVRACECVHVSVSGIIM